MKSSIFILPVSSNCTLHTKHGEVDESESQKHEDCNEIKLDEEEGCNEINEKKEESCSGVENSSWKTEIFAGIQREKGKDWSANGDPIKRRRIIKKGWSSGSRPCRQLARRWALKAWYLLEGRPRKDRRC